MTVHRPTKALINLDALSHNLVQLRQVPGAENFLCPMIKANAYGHGDDLIARALQDLEVDTVGVCLIEEAIRIRKCGFSNDILLFGGFSKNSISEIQRLKLTAVVSDWQHLHDLAESSLGQMKVHVKFDTGMNRLGFKPSDSGRLIQFFQSHPNLKVAGILTHLAKGEDSSSVNGMSAQQGLDFLPVVEDFEAKFGREHCVHVLNTAAIINKVVAIQNKSYSPFFGKMNWGFRPGIGLYGVNPMGENVGLQLKPVLSLQTKMIQVRELKAGDFVSYNSTWKATEPTKIAVLPVGYADGVHRVLSNKQSVLVDGRNCPIVGNICMDFMMVDIGANSKAKIGDVVTIIGASRGQTVAVDSIARNSGTIPWEVLTSIGPRVHREPLREGQASLLRDCV